MKHPLLNVPLNAKIRVHGILYNQVEIADTKNLNLGDLIFDCSDFTYGVCDLIHDDKHIVVKSDWAAEVGVHISRVRKLVPSLETNSQN